MASFLSEVREALGRENVIDKSDFVRAWDIAQATFSPEVPYTLDTVKECAKQNENDEAKWKLIYFWGFPLSELCKRIGVDTSSPLSFDPHCAWCLEEEWTHVAPQSGFYLVDFRSRLEFRKAESSLVVAEDDKVVIDSRCKRPHEAIVVENAITITKITGQWPLEGYLLGTSRTQDRRGQEIVIVNNDGKIEICKWGLTFPQDQLNTYRMWIPEEEITETS